jgi:hypothetical protein
MLYENVEKLMGHRVDYCTNSYYKPTDKDLLEDYLKAVPDLTIYKTEGNEIVENQGMIAVDMDPIMRPWSIRDRCVRIWNQKRRKPDQDSKNNGAGAGTTFVEQVG